MSPTVTDMQDGATENIRTYGLYNGKPAVSVQVFQQPGANIIEVVDAVKAELPLLRASIDPKIDLVVTFDRSITIRASLRQVEQTLLLAVAMVILVVYMFLNSYRAALIPAVVVPVSLIGTFAAMYLLDYTLDNFSLMALTIATGFVVDDAIVVMENTTRHIEAGMTRMQAALHGRRGGGLHGRFHEPVAGCGVHSFSARGRHRGQAVPRIHRHPVGGHPHLAGDLADHDADDVLAPAGARSGPQARPVSPPGLSAASSDVRERLRAHARPGRSIIRG